MYVYTPLFIFFSFTDPSYVLVSCLHFLNCNSCLSPFNHLLVPFVRGGGGDFLSFIMFLFPSLFFHLVLNRFCGRIVVTVQYTAQNVGCGFTLYNMLCLDVLFICTVQQHAGANRKTQGPWKRSVIQPWGAFSELLIMCTCSRRHTLRLMTHNWGNLTS
jgi:hypothetical protein